MNIRLLKFSSGSPVVSCGYRSKMSRRSKSWKRSDKKSSSLTCSQERNPWVIFSPKWKPLRSNVFIRFLEKLIFVLMPFSLNIQQRLQNSRVGLFARFFFFGSSSSLSSSYCSTNSSFEKARLWWNSLSVPFFKVYFPSSKMATLKYPSFSSIFNKAFRLSYGSSSSQIPIKALIGSNSNRCVAMLALLRREAVSDQAPDTAEAQDGRSLCFCFFFFSSCLLASSFYHSSFYSSSFSFSFCQIQTCQVISLTTDLMLFCTFCGISTTRSKLKTLLLPNQLLTSYKP